MMNVITTVPERSHYLDHFRDKLSNPIFVEDEKRSAMDTFLRACALVGDEPAFMFQDDAIVCDNFERRAFTVVSQRPFTLINFFSMRNDDETIGSRLSKNFLGCVGYYMPPNTANRIISHFHDYWVPANYEGNKPTSATDLLIRSYLDRNKLKHWIEVPNLVDHRVVKSAIDPRRSSKRVSRTYRG